MRRVLMPKWWLLHAFVVVAVLVMLRLGLWQLHRAESPNGGMQNWAYALQWPLFAVFAVVLWVKTLAEELRRDPDAESADGTGGAAQGRGDGEQMITRRPGVRVGITTQHLSIDDDDPEVAAYNARLAALNARAAAANARRR